MPGSEDGRGRTVTQDFLCWVRNRTYELFLTRNNFIYSIIECSSINRASRVVPYLIECVGVASAWKTGPSIADCRGATELLFHMIQQAKVYSIFINAIQQLFNR